MAATTPPPYPDPIPGGGVWNGTGWVPKNNPAASQFTGAQGVNTSTSNTMNFTPTAAPTFTAPKWNGPTTPAPTLTMPGAFKAPTAADMVTDPGFQFRLAQGQQALENSASARGTLRGGAQLKGLVDYQQGAASQEYQNAYNRSRDVYNAAMDQATTGYGAAKDVYNADATERQNAFNANFQGAQAAFTPQMATWQAQNAAGANNATMNFNRQWDADVYNRDSAFREAESGRNDSYRNRALSLDDTYRYANLDEQRRQFLVSQGNR